jgi:hypothetical protein
MMNKTFGVILNAGFLLFSAATMELVHAQDKRSGKRSLQVKLNYTGSGRVDEKHKIWFFFLIRPILSAAAQHPLRLRPQLRRMERLPSTT